MIDALDPNDPPKKYKDSLGWIDSKDRPQIFIFSIDNLIYQFTWTTKLQRKQLSTEYFGAEKLNSPE
jgi:hypothetical protein